MPSFSGLFDGVHGTPHALLGTRKIGNAETQLARLVAPRSYGRGVVRAVLTALTGAAVGGTASSSHKRLKAVADLDSNGLGGVREIEVFSGVNRATVAGDETKLDGAATLSAKPTYPHDASGNGGGAKLGW